MPCTQFLKPLYSLRHRSRIYQQKGLLFCLLLSLPLFVRAQAASETLPIPAPVSGFYFRQFVDARPETEKSTAGEGSAKNPLPDLFSSLKATSPAYTPANEADMPIRVYLSQGSLLETSDEKGLREGQLQLSLHFALERGNDTLPLTGYSASLRYKRSANNLQPVHQLVQQTLAKGLRYFTDWYQKEADTNPRLARKVELIFSEQLTAASDDTVYYRPDRPLRWSDFRGTPQAGRFAASIFPNFAYNGRQEVVNGVLKAYVNIRVYMLKSSSWVRAHAQDAYSLNHEQRHFDLVKLVAERFKERLRQEDFLPEEYSGRLGYFYLEAYREMNRLQDAYDRETRHGLDEQAQERWNKKITEELKAYGQSEWVKE